MILHDYQSYAVEQIVSRPRLGLFLGMGMGKTIITLTAIQRLRDAGTVRRVLVIAPLLVAKNTWAQEAELWNVPLRISVIVGTPSDRVDALRRDADVYVINREMTAWLFQQKVFQQQFDMLVLDESTSFKNPSSQRFKALKKQRFERVLLLSGTPIANNLLDLWAQIFLLDRGQRLDTAITRYRQRHFKPLYVGPIPIYRDPLPGSKEAIIDKIKDITLVMQGTSQDVVKRNIYTQVDNGVYMRMRDEFIVNSVIAVNAAVLLGKLQQITSGFLYGTEHHTEYKLDALRAILENAQENGEQVLCFYRFEEDKRRLLSVGGREINEQSISDWNAGRCPLLIAHPASAGFGLNLQQGGHIIVWYNLTWSYEQYEQANARLARQGQNHTVVVYHLLARGTVDEYMLNTLGEKKNVSDYLLWVLSGGGYESIRNN